jgi:hypothetical protein
MEWEAKTGTNADQYAQIHGSPGARSRGFGLLKSLWPVGVILFFMGYLISTVIPPPEISNGIASLLFLAIAVCMAATANKARTRIRNHAKGAQGEELAARLLATLPASCDVFHGVACKGGLQDMQGGADIDHIVITPNCVFAIETKHWQGAITVEEEQLLQDDILPDRDPIEQTLQAANRVSREIMQLDIPSPEIIPVLLLTANRLRNTPTICRSVTILDLDHLIPYLQNTGKTPIPKDTRARIVEHLKTLIEP